MRYNIEMELRSWEKCWTQVQSIENESKRQQHWCKTVALWNPYQYEISGMKSVLPNCIAFEIGYVFFFVLFVFFGQFMMELCIPIDILKCTSVRITVNRLTHKAHAHMHMDELLRACVHVYVSKKKKNKHSNSTSNFVYGQSKPFVARVCSSEPASVCAQSLATSPTHASVVCKTNFYLLWS